MSDIELPDFAQSPSDADRLFAASRRNCDVTPQRNVTNRLTGSLGDSHSHDSGNHSMSTNASCKLMNTLAN